MRQWGERWLRSVYAAGECMFEHWEAVLAPLSGITVELSPSGRAHPRLCDKIFAAPSLIPHSGAVWICWLLRGTESDVARHRIIDPFKVRLQIL